MILNEKDQEFFYEGKRYYIGQQIIGADASEYEGLFGTITEIRDGEDKDTQNETPDIYCDFEVPEMPYDIKRLEARFSELYDEPKTIDDIILDLVIMAPEMIESIDEPRQTQKVYIVVEDSEDDEKHNVDFVLATNMEAAKKEMRRMLRKKMLNSDLRRKIENEEYIVESEETKYLACTTFFEAGHYALYIKEQDMITDAAFLERIASMNRETRYEEDYLGHIQEKLEHNEITQAKYDILMKYPVSGEEISTALSKNDSYWNAYWQTMENIIENVLAGGDGS